MPNELRSYEHLRKETRDSGSAKLKKKKKLAKVRKNGSTKICACVLCILAIILTDLFHLTFPQTDTMVNKSIKPYVHISVAVLRSKSQPSPKNTALPQNKSEIQ